MKIDEGYDEDRIVEDQAIETYLHHLEGVALGDGFLRVIADNGGVNLEVRVPFAALTHFGFAHSEKALDLLNRAASHMSDIETGPPDNWWKEFFQLTGTHMILTEEGWEDGEAKASYLKDDPEWKPLDEVCAPAPSPFEE